MQLNYLIILNLVLLGCGKDNSKVVLSNNSNNVVILTDSTLSFFSKNTILPSTFYVNSANNYFCTDESYTFGCYDKNRNSY